MGKITEDEKNIMLQEILLTWNTPLQGHVATIIKATFYDTINFLERNGFDIIKVNDNETS